MMRGCMSVLSRLALVDLVPLGALGACLAATVIGFVWRTAVDGMPRTARIDRVPRSPYLPRALMELGYFSFRQPVRLCRALGLSPDALTYASLAVTALGGVALGAGRFSLGGFVLLFGFALDAWDGMLARETGRASVRGEYLDAVVDRYSDLFALLGLLYYWRNDPLPLAAAAAALVGATLTSYTRAKGEACGVDADTGFMQRHERAVWLGMGALLSPVAAVVLEPGAPHRRHHLAIAVLVVIALATNVTAIARARLCLRALGKEAPR